MNEPDLSYVLRNFWTPLLTLLTLLGALLLFLGIALAGLVTALRNRERERARFRKGLGQE